MGLKSNWNNIKWISPAALCRQSVLAGALFVVTSCVLFVNIFCVVAQGIAMGWISAWQTNDTVVKTIGMAPLEGLQMAQLAAIFWFCMQICLVLDVLLSMTLATREFQEGTARMYGIVAIFQVPITVGFVLYETGADNENWMKQACHIIDIQGDCDKWWLTLKTTVVWPVIVSNVLHLITAAMSFRYSLKEAARTSMVAYVHKPKPEKSKSKSNKVASTLSRPPPGSFGTAPPQSAAAAQLAAFRSRTQSKPSSANGSILPTMQNPNPLGEPFSSESEDEKQGLAPPGYASKPPSWKRPSSQGSGRTVVSAVGPDDDDGVTGWKRSMGNMFGRAGPQGGTPSPIPAHDDSDSDSHLPGISGGNSGAPSPLSEKPAMSMGHRRSSRSNSKSRQSSRSDREGRSRMRSLPKVAGRGHKRTASTLEDFKKELGHSDDEIDQLVPHTEEKDDGMEGRKTAEDVAVRTSSDESESSSDGEGSRKYERRYQ